MKNLRQVAIRYLLEQKKRTVLIIIGITISIAMMTSIGTMSYSFDQNEMQNIISSRGYNHAAFVNISAEEYKYINNNVSFSHVAKSTLAGTAEHQNDSGASNFIELIGYEEEYLEMRNMLPVEGRLPEDEGEIVLERWKAFDLGIEIGEEVTLPVGHLKQNEEILTRGHHRYDGVIFHETFTHTFQLVGILESESYSQNINHSRAIVDLSWAQGVNDTDKVTTIVRVKEGFDVLDTLEEVADELGFTEGVLEYNSMLIHRERNGFPAPLIAVATFLIALVCVATVAVIFNAFNISVLERIKQFGVMRSIGTTPRQIRKLVLIEATVLGFISIPLGLVTGFYCTKLLFYLFTLGEFSSFENFNIVTSPIVLQGSSMIGLVAVYLSAFVPAVGAGRVSPLDAIFQHRSLKKDNKTKKGSLVRKVFGGEVVATKEYPVSPVLKLEQINDHVKETHPDIGETGILMGSLHGYNEEMLELAEMELIDGKADIDLLNEELGVWVVIYNEFYEYDEKNGRERRVIKKSVDVNVGDIITLSLGPEVYPGIEEEVNEDDLVQVKVMGLLEKKPFGQPYEWYPTMGFITTDEVYEQVTGASSYSKIYVNMDQDNKYNEIFTVLDHITNETNRVVYDNIAANRAGRQMIFEASVLVYGFIILISLIGALNIINTISTNLLTRTKEFGMLRAVGMSPKSMRRMIRMEAIFTSATGTIFGLIVGNLLGYYLFTLIAEYEGYPWVFPYKTNTIVVVATVLIALLAAAAPLRKIASLNIIDTIKED